MRTNEALDGAQGALMESRMGRYPGARQRPYLARGAQPLNIAHRGGAHELPESTMLAFERAARELKVDVIEIDVWLTADGEVVVFHDASVDRVTDGVGRIAQRTLAELQALDAAHRFSPPGDEGRWPYRGQGLRIETLDAVLVALPEQRFNIDLKDNAPALIDATLDVLRRHDAWLRVGLGTFHDRLAWEIARAAPPEVCVTAPASVVAELVWAARGGRPIEGARVVDVPFDVLQIPRRYLGLELISPALVAAYHAAGWYVHVWTINDVNEMRALIAMDVDGIVTDRPSRLGEVLAEGARALRGG